MAGENVVRPIRSVLDAATSGDERELLLALRDRVASAVNDSKTSARDLAPLTRRLQEINKDLADFDARKDKERSDGPSTGDEPWDESNV